jgi:predicted nuclease of predicted toxin-antitoxin system
MKQNHWRLIADLNISIATVTFLESIGIDARRAEKTLLTDEAIVDAGIKEKRAILTFDKDFGEIYYFHKKKQFTAILLRLEDQTAESVNRVLHRSFTTVQEPVEHTLFIVNEHRYRKIT